MKTNPTPQPIEQEVETARHLYTVLGIMWDDAQSHLDKAQELSYSKKEKLAEEEYQKAYKIHDEATEYAESWKQEAILNERSRVVGIVESFDERRYWRYWYKKTGNSSTEFSAGYECCLDDLLEALSNPTTLDTVNEGTK